MKAMVLNSKKWEQLAKLIEKEHERGPISVLKKIAEHGNLGPAVVERLGKLMAQDHKRKDSALEKKLADDGLPSVIGRKLAKSNPLSFVDDYLQSERMAFDGKTWERIFERLNREHPPAQFDIVKGLTEKKSTSRERRQVFTKPDAIANPRDFLSIAELARRWCCSRGTVYNRLRAVGAQVLDFASRGRRSRKAVSLKTVLEIEGRQTRRLR